MEAHKIFIHKIFILLLALIVSCESWCPLDSRVEQDDPGCDKCTCCRFRSGEYLVLCASRGLSSIPDVPRDVTHLDMFNNSIARLDDKTFPYLPHLSSLQLSPSQIPLTQITAGALKQLPNLRNLSLDISLEEVKDFLSSTRVDELKVNCSNKITQANIKIMIGTRGLQNLTAFNCTALPLDETSYNIPPKRAVVHFIAGNLPESFQVRLPESNVEVHFESNDVFDIDTTELCFNLTDVSAVTLLLSCQARLLKMEDSHLLDWVDRTSARVSLRIHYTVYNSHFRFHLGSNSFYSLEALAPEVQVQYDDATVHQFIEDLLHSMNTTRVHRLRWSEPLTFAQYPIILGQNFLQQLIHSGMRELELEGFPIGNIGDLDVYLSTFICRHCKIICLFADFLDCLKRVPARQLLVDNTYEEGSLFNLSTFLTDHLDLETLVMVRQNLNVLTIDLPAHEKITDLQIVRTSRTTTYPWVTRTIRVSSLVNLQHLVISGVSFYGDMVVDQDFRISNLPKLISLDFTDVTIPRLHGQMENVFVGCNSLAQLRLKRSNFWSKVEHLAALLSPVTDTLEEVDLSGNDIDHLPPDMFTGMHNLRRLNLSNNALTVLDGCTFSQNTVLSELSLIGNHLGRVVGTACLEGLAYLRVVELWYNLLECTCDNRQLRDWIRHDLRTNVRYISHDEHCRPMQQSAAVEFLDYSLPWIACDFNKEKVISGVAIFALGLMVIAMYAVYYYRYDFWFWWVVKRRHRFNRQHRIHPERKFHAFLSYSSSEQLIAEYMFEELEGGQDVRFKIAYDCRDFLPLYDIADNIIRCIDQSEKVIFLISKRFLEREWCQFEINFAQMRCFDERKNLIILIFLERFRADELPKRLRILRRHVNYLEYPDHTDRRVVRNFWHRLRLALAQDSQVEVEERQPLLSRNPRALAYTI